MAGRARRLGLRHDVGGLGHRSLTAVVVIGSIGGQRPKQAGKVATRLAAEGVSPSAELRALLSDRTAIALNYLAAVALLAIIVLMVVKPGSPHP